MAKVIVADENVIGPCGIEIISIMFKSLWQKLLVLKVEQDIMTDMAH